MSNDTNKDAEHTFFSEDSIEMLGGPCRDAGCAAIPRHAHGPTLGDAAREASEDFPVPFRASNNLVTSLEALECAKQFIARGERRAEIVKKLQEDDMLGLECSETVELERLAAADARDGWKLAKWVVLFGCRVPPEDTAQ